MDETFCLVCAQTQCIFVPIILIGKPYVCYCLEVQTCMSVDLIERAFRNLAKQDFCKMFRNYETERPSFSFAINS